MIHRADLLKCPYVSVIIPTFCRPAPLQRCLASLSVQDQPRGSFEIIVVNDGGDPSPIEEIRSRLRHGFAFTSIHREHQGIAAARSCGIKHSRGEILAFLDDDCTVPSDYIAAIVQTFQTYPETQVIQVALENPEPENIFGDAWKRTFDSALKANLSPAPYGRLVSGILGGVMVTRRTVFEKVSYDTSARLTREDADLRCQLHQFNIPVHYEPQIRVYHFCRKTLRGYLSQHFLYGRGNFQFRQKWGRKNLPFQGIRWNPGKDIRSMGKSRPYLKELAIRAIIVLRQAASFCGLLVEKVKWSLSKAGNSS